LYKKLYALKKTNRALWNGKPGARMQRVPNSQLSDVLSFVRQNKQDQGFAVFNFCAQARRFASANGCTTALTPPSPAVSR